MSRSSFFTSESVTEGHPDKICDQISDAVLDAALLQNPSAHVACESFVTTDYLMVGGEITAGLDLSIPSIARRVIRKIGYTDPELGFDSESCSVVDRTHEQSADIARGVDRQGIETQGAGDQGMMFGFACRETPQLMPLPIQMAHNLTRRLTQARKSKRLSYLRPDGKSQVTIRYEEGRPAEVDNVVISTQHAPLVASDRSSAVKREQDRIKRDLFRHVVKPLIPAKLKPSSWTAFYKSRFHCNPTGRFVIGGPHGDTGLTGRKIIVDTYGGMGRHGGGAFSGKDPSKVDRSAAYAARWVAKHIVAARLAQRAEVRVSYAIGRARPTSVDVEVDTYGTSTVKEARIALAILQVFDLRPGAVVRDLKLKRPVFSPTAAYGHFGRSGPGFTWEKISAKKIRQLRKAVS